MHYTHTVGFELTCKINKIYTYSDAYLYDYDEIKEDLRYYICEDGADLVMDLGGWVFVNNKPYRYITLFIEDLSGYLDPSILLDDIKHDRLYLTNFIECGDSYYGGDSCIIVALEDIELYTHIKNEFKKGIIDLLL